MIYLHADACTPNHSTPADCKEALDNGHNISGVYRVTPDDLEPFDVSYYHACLATNGMTVLDTRPMQVYCDMETDGGGWTVFQRRQDGSEDFYRGWDNYVSGFGSLTGEFWLGLENIHRLTNRSVTKLRVDLSDFDGNTAFAKYNTFRVLSSSTNYTLNVSGYSGTAGDSLTQHNGYQFSTEVSQCTLFCSHELRGAWWHNTCNWSNLNGLYLGSQSDNCTGVVWWTWKSYFSLEFAEMKLQ